MLSLSDTQLATVADAARAVPVDRRSLFLERCAALLRERGSFDDGDVGDVVELAQCGLVRRETMNNL
jgi:hypothetical protein